jgi:hypothetical protein
MQSLGRSIQAALEFSAIEITYKTKYITLYSVLIQGHATICMQRLAPLSPTAVYEGVDFQMLIIDGNHGKYSYL